MNSKDIDQLVAVVMGRVEEWDLVPGTAKQKAEQVKEQLMDPESRKRLEEMADFVKNVRPGMEGFPRPPKDVGDDRGVALENWILEPTEEYSITI